MRQQDAPPASGTLEIPHDLDRTPSGRWHTRELDMVRTSGTFDPDVRRHHHAGDFVLFTDGIVIAPIAMGPDRGPAVCGREANGL